MKSITAKAKILVRAPALSVYNAFVNAETMSKFWFTRRDEGLVEGELVYWYVGTDADAYAIEVRVKELRSAQKILIEWGKGETFTQVQWLFEATEHGTTKLIIEESGFAGSDEEIITNVLDSTGGFNQVVMAVKALLEYDSHINIVTDHLSDDSR